MKPPRFGMKTILIAFTGIALWLSTFANYPGAMDVQSFMMLAAVVSSGVAAYAHTGRRRAFWLGFFGTLFLTLTKTSSVFGGNFQWLMTLSRDLASQIFDNPIGNNVMSVNKTIFFAALLIAATLIGLFCVFVYDQAKRNPP